MRPKSIFLGQGHEIQWPFSQVSWSEEIMLRYDFSPFSAALTSPGQLAATQRPGGLFCKRFSSGLSAVALLEPVFTHLKFPGTLLSLHIIHHHQISVHRSLRAVSAFSLLCYCGLEGHMGLERTVMSEPGLRPHPSAGQRLIAAPSCAHK